MAGPEGPITEDSAEKAYAAAAGAVPARPAEEAAVEFPPKAKRGRKPRPLPASDLPELESPNAAMMKAGPVEPAATGDLPSAKPAKLRMGLRKAVKAKPAQPKPAPVKLPPAKNPVGRVVPAPKTQKAGVTENIIPTISQLKDKIMATQNTDFSEGIKSFVSEAQEKAKTAFDKSASTLGEYSEFAKGNVEAAVESGKILAAGLQQIGNSYVTEGKSAFDTLTADVKELAATKTPADFFKLQGDLARRNFDSAVAFGSKNSEAFLKLANDVMAPLSNRVSIAVEKVKQAA